MSEEMIAALKSLEAALVDSGMEAPGAQWDATDLTSRPLDTIESWFAARPESWRTAVLPSFVYLDSGDHEHFAEQLGDHPGIPHWGLRRIDKVTPVFAYDGAPIVVAAVELRGVVGEFVAVIDWNPPAIIKIRSGSLADFFGWLAAMWWSDGFIVLPSGKAAVLADHRGIVSAMDL